MRECQHCKIFEGALVKAPLCPIRAYSPLELVHVDFTSIKTTMELNKPPSIKNVLVLTDHFMRYSMAFVTKDQKAKTVMCILYERFIAVFGTPTKLLSDCGANFTSALVEELCSAFGIQKCRTTTYHAQCMGRWKDFTRHYFEWLENWPRTKRLNGSITSPSWHRPITAQDQQLWGIHPITSCLGDGQDSPLIFFPHDRCRYMHCRWVPAYIEEVQKCFKEAHTEAQHQSNNEADRQKRNYDKFTSTVQLMLGDMVLTKADAFQGKRKVKDRWNKVEYEVVCQVTNGAPSYEIKDASSNVKVAHHNRLFLVATPQGAPTALCQSEDASVDLTTHSALVELTPLECDNDLLRNTMEERLSQCSTSLVPFGQVDGILQPLPMVVPSTAMKDNRDRMKDEHASNDEPHWVLPVNFQARILLPKFQVWTGGGEDYK